MSWPALTVFLLLFVAVTAIGFAAANWRKGDLNHLDEWGLGGRSFGTLISWFLLGGDLYTAYTFVAIPALVFGAGATGFFAVPYTILIYPFAFIVFARLWTVAHRHGSVTLADFAGARYGFRWLTLALAVTGILATMPYIALQLVGIQVVLAGLGFPTRGFLGELPLIIAFVVLAAYTYSSGLRAPAAIAVVKDVLIYVTIIAAIIVIPHQLGGFGAIFGSVPARNLLLAPASASSTGGVGAYLTLAIGSALALFLYPHSATAILSSRSSATVRRNMALLPAYSLVLGLLALLGFMAFRAGVGSNPRFAEYFAQYGNTFSVPALFLQYFPGWFVGVAFAAVAIGALVPAAIMSIAAANLYTRNVYRPFLNPGCTPAQETHVAKIASLLVKFGALLFIIFLPTKLAVQFQLLGGIWIIQLLPAVVIGAFTRFFDPRALLTGWAAGMIGGTWMAASLGFKTSTFPLVLGGLTIPGYAAVYALLINLAVSVVLTLILKGAGRFDATDHTVAADYLD